MNRKLFYGLYRAETTIQHQADEKMETTSLFRSNTAILPGGKKIKNYNVSAASFRHQIRHHATTRMLDLLDVKVDDLPEITNVVLFSGGPRLDKTKKTGDKKLAQGAIPILYSNAVCEALPIMDLLGGTCQFCMVPHNGSKLAATSLNVLTFDMVNFHIERQILKHHKIVSTSLPKTATEFQFNAKRDPRNKYEPDDDSKKDSDCGTVGNIFDVQYVCKGTLFGNQISIAEREDGLLSSCFASAIEEWQRCGGYIAGKKSNGAGVLSCAFSPGLPESRHYEDYITKNKTRLKEIILDAQLWKDPWYFDDNGEDSEPKTEQKKKKSKKTKTKEIDQEVEDAIPGD